jgi:hypothetical protein
MAYRLLFARFLLPTEGGFHMSKKVLLLSLVFFAASWAMAPPGAEAISCISVSNVTLLGPAGCELGG